MKTLVIGDLHGRWEIAQKALDTGYNCVFVGDYIDSFDRSIEDQVNTLMIVLEAIENEPLKHVGLIGNHELSYLDDTMRASGYNRSMSYHIVHGLRQRMGKLEPYLYIGDYLISHAGVSNALLEEQDLSLEDYLDRRDFKDIGHRRGGMSPVGGLYWCDWYAEFEPVPGQLQIVGHTGYREKGDGEGIIEREGSFNIDCLDRVSEVLLLEDGKASIITL